MGLTRRDFTRLSMAALGGVMAGCSGGDKPVQPPTAGAGTPPAETTSTNTPAPAADAVASKQEIHACRGLNSCKGLGKGGENACAGQGSCFTAKAHDCSQMNDCKNQGGCGEKPGFNDCKGMGGCGLPMTHGDAWEMARKTFEEKMKAAGKEFGAAPKPKES